MATDGVKRTECPVASMKLKPLFEVVGKMHCCLTAQHNLAGIQAYH